MGFRPFRTRRWLPRGHVARRTRGLLLGGVWLRCLTWWRAHDLDDQLAYGADPMHNDELSLRVGQLAPARSRGRFVCALRGAVELADRPFDPLRMGPPSIRRAEVRENQELLLALAERLSAGGPLGVKGLAVTTLLVGDGFSPLFCKAASSSLTASAEYALLALEQGHRPTATSALPEAWSAEAQSAAPRNCACACTA
jgi:hypothetical protein